MPDMELIYFLDCAIKEWEEQIEGVDSVVDCAPNGNYAK